MNSDRQIPLETIFMSNSSSSYKDKLHPNRFHFHLPDSWTDNVSKNAIIGIRDMYITKAFRKLKFKVEWKLVSNNGQEQLTAASDYLVIEKFFDDETKLKDLITTMNNAFSFQIKPDIFNEATGFSSNQLSKISRTEYLTSNFEFKSKDTYFSIYSPFNDLDASYRTVDNKVYSIHFRISEANDDAINVLNLVSVIGADFTPYNIVTHNIWDRNSCIIYSNLACTTENNFIGHARRYGFNTIKYFTVTSSNKSFYVDLYATCSHDTPVILPKDNKDELYIEVQLLTSANAVL